jgi:Rrf2 family protein
MPIQMSTRSRYGLRLMLALALNYGQGITLMKEVSRREGISEKYLGQIIIPLKNAGLVTSQRGAHGGYALSRPPEEITVRDVVVAIEGNITPVPCLEDPEACARVTSCVATRVWKKLAEDMEGSLSSFTLAELARQAREIKEPVSNYSI